MATTTELARSRAYWRKRSAKALAQRRRAQTIVRRIDHKIAAEKRASSSGREAAVKFALAHVGKANESPPGSNRGPAINAWIASSGYGAQAVPWCQCFANACAVAGGAAQVRSGYTPTFLEGHAPGYRPIAASSARPGDFVYFKWPGVSRASCDHVGVLVSMTASTVTCVEGNTSPGNAGSQNNGGGVFLRTRPRSVVAGFVRPPYPGS